MEKIKLHDGFLKYKRPDGSKAIIELGKTDHKGAIEAILRVLTDKTDGVIASFDEIGAVGHRLVHGGEKFSSSVLIDDAVKEMVRECYPLAPPAQPREHDGCRGYNGSHAGRPTGRRV